MFEFRSLGPRLIGIFMVFLSAIGFAQAEPEVVLRSDSWTITINPNSLQVIAEPVKGESIELSLPQQDLGPLESLEHTESEVSWELPQEGIAVSFRLDGAQLSAHFRSQQIGSFTWPVLSTDSPVQACILPLFEGSYVPADDAKWIEFLAASSPRNTLEGLSMPFWGLDCGDYTMTYILTNPFGNELAFEDDDGRIAMQFTHKFTRLWKEKEYGLSIHLGDASPIEPAKQYRQWLIQQDSFVSLK
ncbi:hypothetical protein ACFL6S_24825, partial [Candidatus Poribacteria bacterium]